MIKIDKKITVFIGDVDTFNQKNIILKSTFNNTLFVNYKQFNKTPVQIRQMLNEEIEKINKEKFSNLIITTYSPYVISFLTLNIEAFNLIIKNNNNNENISELKKSIDKIVPIDSLIDYNEFECYEINDNLQIKLLGNYEGLPTNNNILNDALKDFNNLFSNLLDIEDKYNLHCPTRLSL